MLLYFNGDSFVAGCELGDDILPKYPGLVSWPVDHDRPHRIWLAQTYDEKHILYRYKHTTPEKLIQLEYERVFPNLVAKLSNMPVINRALGGSSMDRIARTTLTDLYTHRKNNPKDRIIAFIGTTHPNRSEIPNELKGAIDLHGFSQDWMCISTTYTMQDRGHHATEMIKLKVLYETNYHAVINFYKNIMTVNNFCKLNNIELHWISTNDNVVQHYPIESYLLDRPDLIMYQECANLNYTLDMREILETEFVGQDVICPGGHFGEQIHERTAQEIVKILYG